MQFISNLAQMVKSPQEDEAKTQDTALDRPKDDHPPQAADPIEAPVAKPTRRRTLPDPKLVRAARLRRRADALPVAPATEDDHGEEQAIAQFLSDATEDKAPARTEPTSMWEAAVDKTQTAPAKTVPSPTRKGTARVKTKLLHFDDDEISPSSVLEDTAPAASSPRVKFPVGWLVLTEGPGRGECFTLRSGVSQIGRDAKETIALDFGDLGISRSNHASIAYDPVDHQFYVGHGGKANIVRLNGKPVLSTELMADGDIVRIGETSLRLSVLCNADFNWSEKTDVDNALLDG